MQHGAHYGSHYSQGPSVYQQQQQMLAQQHQIAHFNQASHQNHSNNTTMLTNQLISGGGGGMMVAGAGGISGHQQQHQQPQQIPPHEESKIYALVIELMDPASRESALLELSKKREHYDDLALVLWHSFGVCSFGRDRSILMTNRT